MNSRIHGFANADHAAQLRPIAHGAPLRLRDERQLGYKMAKYVMRIDLVADFAQTGNGNGRYWEDQGYEWWAGI
jgi:DMSO/TMAO reductase YedYZ molybdopterin-dependent catalytic subunit